MLKKGVPIGGKSQGDIQHGCIFEGLLHSMADSMVIILGLNNGDGDVRLIIQNIINTFGSAPGDGITTDIDAAIGQGNFFQKLGLGIPSGSFQSRCNEFGANIAF